MTAGTTASDMCHGHIAELLLKQRKSAELSLRILGRLSKAREQFVPRLAELLGE